MKLGHLVQVLRSLAPEILAEPWDRVGLQVGSHDQQIRQAMLCIDLTEPVLGEAIGAGVDLIVAYHPPIFHPLTALTDEQVKQHLVLGAARAGLAIYSPHTALDAAADGLNDWLAAGLGVGRVRPIRQAATSPKSYKLVSFVPQEAADSVRCGLAAAGAGRIGHYRECSFSVLGEGTFRGDATTHPAVGRAGRFERARELRIEIVVSADRLGAAVAALRDTHPYEEPAFDVYPLESVASAGTGQGRVTQLARPIGLETLLQRIKSRLGVKHLEVARPVGARSAAGQKIQRVGLCAGSGGSLLGEAGPLDAFLTGEMQHHDILAATADRITIVLAGHSQTERPYLKTYRKRIIAASKDHGGSSVEWLISRTDRPPSTTR